MKRKNDEKYVFFKFVQIFNDSVICFDWWMDDKCSQMCCQKISGFQKSVGSFSERSEISDVKLLSLHLEVRIKNTVLKKVIFSYNYIGFLLLFFFKVNNTKRYFLFICMGIVSSFSSLCYFTSTRLAALIFYITKSCSNKSDRKSRLFLSNG